MTSKNILEKKGSGHANLLILKMKCSEFVLIEASERPFGVKNTFLRNTRDRLFHSSDCSNQMKVH